MFDMGRMHNRERISFSRQEDVLAGTVRLVLTLTAIFVVIVSLWACGSSSQASTASAMPRTIPTSAPPSASSSDAFGGWNTAAIAVTGDPTLGVVYVANYNYLNGHSTLFMPQKYRKPQFDGIASSGSDMLIQLSSSGHTFYTRVRVLLPNTGFFYELDDAAAGNAIWMPDSRHVLILERNVGVMEVDTLTGKAQNVLPLPLSKNNFPIVVYHLVFYRAGYLYFTGAGGGACMGALCRVQIGTGNRNVTELLGRQMDTTYWLSPDGSTIYYANTGPAGEPGIYAVNSDGTNFRMLRTYGVPIGYAADNSLVIMREVQGKFQVVKLGATPSQDQVMMADAAPGAASLCSSADAQNIYNMCDNSIALAPYGHALIVQGTYADGTNKVWSDDLTTGKQFILQPGLGEKVPVQLLGWDRLPTP